MKRKLTCFLACCGILLGSIQTAIAHEGRRMDIQVLNNQLVAQGYISGAVDPSEDDGGGLIRPYYNAIHGHWSNSPGVSATALATLPGFDVLNPNELTEKSLVLELMGAQKWVNPIPAMDGMLHSIGTPQLEDMAVDEILYIGFGPNLIDTNALDISSDPKDSLGNFSIATGIPASGVRDIDLEYSIDGHPTDAFYAIEWKLSAPGSSILDSDSIYTILAPDPKNKSDMVRHHYHQSALAMERFLGVSAIPEPSAASLLAVLSLFGLRRKRRTVCV